MSKGIFYVPEPFNEPVFSYAPGSPERTALRHAIKIAKSRKANIPMFIGGREVRTSEIVEIRPPHELGHTLGLLHCTQYPCAMHASRTADDIDLKTPHFCTDCAHHIHTKNIFPQMCT